MLAVVLMFYDVPWLSLGLSLVEGRRAKIPFQCDEAGICKETSGKMSRVRIDLSHTKMCAIPV